MKWRPAVLGALGSLVVGCGSPVRPDPVAPPGHWGSPQRLGETSPVYYLDSGGDAPLAADERGNALAVWAGPFGAGKAIWASRFEAGTWTRPQPLGRPDPIQLLPVVAVSPAGDALAVWATPDPGVGNATLWAARFSPASGWRPAEALGHCAYSGDTGLRPAVTVDSGGQAVVACHDRSGPAGENEIVARRWTSSAGWSLPMVISASVPRDTAAFFKAPQVASGANGAVHVVWDELIGGRGYPHRVWASGLEDLLGPEAAAVLGSGGAARVAANGRGQGAVAWVESVTGGGTLLRVSPLRNGRWQAAEATGLSFVPGPPPAIWFGVYSPSLALNAAGHTFVAWRTGTDHQGHVQVARSVAPGIWEDSGPLDREGRNALRPALALDASGGAVVAWQELPIGPGRRDLALLRAAHFVPGGGWSRPEPIAATDAMVAHSPYVAALPNGDALAVWVENEGDRLGVWTSRFAWSERGP